MNSIRLCPKCHKPFAPDAPDGICPECLLKVALFSQTAIGSELSSVPQEEPLATQTISPTAGMRVKYFGDYELLEEIARGGMGVVWKARQNSLNRTVAIKMILAGKLADAAEVQRFLREAEAAANLQHPNIVAIHEVGEHDGQNYFSMDYVEGRDLGALVREGALPAQRAARYVKIIAEAIHFAHQRGTLHRDLKPQNVLIDASDQPHITDFGLAKFVEHDSGLTQTGAVMGSPSYMPPEQASGRHNQVGPHSDVYAIGAILYELLTGRPPFRGATAMATLRAVMESDAIAPRKLNTGVPPDLETICLKCLEKSPERRYHSARELAEDLQRYLNCEPIFARPASVLRKAISWTRRHPLALAGAATLIVVSLAFFTFNLIEENAFLRAQQADPGLTRQPGSRSRLLETWSTLSFFVFLVPMFCLLAIRSRARQVNLSQWRDLFDPVKSIQPLNPLTSRTRAVLAVLGVATLAYGLVFLAKIIQTHVWEGSVRTDYFLGVWIDVWIGLTLLWLVARDYHRNVIGAPSREFSDDQRAAIRAATLEFDLPAAIRLYREAVPEAGVAEARDYVAQLAADLQAKEPARFVIPALSLKTLNWKLTAICAGIEMVIIGVGVVLFPAMQSTLVAYQLSTGLLLGVGALIGARLKGFWKRSLALMPGFVMIVLGSEFLPRTPGTPHLFGWAYMLGVAGGVFLMMSAYTKDRRPKA